MGEMRVHDLGATSECVFCLGSGYHFIGSIGEEGEEIVEAYPCRHCAIDYEPATEEEANTTSA